MEQRLETLERAHLSRQPNNPASIDVSHIVAGSANAPNPLPASIVNENPDPQGLVEANSHGPVLNLSSNLGIFPASSIDAQASRTDDPSGADVVSRKVVSPEVATECLNYFLEHLNQYLHDILQPDITLADLRTRSALLTAAICTVACLCSTSGNYRVCHDALVAEVSAKLFSSKYCYDDVRALCIAALWLDDIAPTLCGLGALLASKTFISIC